MEIAVKLFHVTTTVNEFAGCKGVPIRWFYCDDRPQPRPYAELIENYDPNDERSCYPEGYIDELFTEDEAKLLKIYLEQQHDKGEVTTIRETSLPIRNRTMAFGACPAGGGIDFYRLYETPGYDLPFRVEGYFDLLRRELVDGSGVYHERLLLVFPNGETRMETNEEAAARERKLLH